MTERVRGSQTGLSDFPASTFCRTGTAAWTIRCESPGEESLAKVVDVQ